MKWTFEPTGTVSWPVQGHDTIFPVNNLFCVGRNYRDHTIEMGGDPDQEPPFFFQKPSNALLRPGGSLQYPEDTLDLQHEVELVVALGKSGYNVKVGDAGALIYGYGVGVDLTRRDLQIKDKGLGRPWFKQKCKEFALMITLMVETLIDWLKWSLIVLRICKSFSDGVRFDLFWMIYRTTPRVLTHTLLCREVII